MAEPRVAVLVERIAGILEELRRIRERLHGLESDRATVGLLTRMVEELQADMPNLARQAADKAVSEYLRRQNADVMSRWRIYAAMLGAGTALGALIVALVLR